MFASIITKQQLTHRRLGGCHDNSLLAGNSNTAASAPWPDAGKSVVELPLSSAWCSGSVDNGRMTGDSGFGKADNGVSMTDGVDDDSDNAAAVEEAALDFSGIVVRPGLGLDTVAARGSNSSKSRTEH